VALHAGADAAALKTLAAVAGSFTYGALSRSAAHVALLELFAHAVDEACLAPKLRPGSILRWADYPAIATATYNACMVLRRSILPAVCAAALVPCLLSQKTVKRPPILGVAHVALKTNDLAAARVFYGHDLGFAEPFTISSGAVFKVNDHQYIEVYSTLKDD
jgi:hypothetical protein